jgi:DNA invertase Pin-like site-specific DNA recombinase
MLVGYARVSSTDQNLERQITALETHGCKVIYKEKISGKESSNRHELQAMLESVRSGDAIVIQKLDRLGRSLKDLFNIVDILKEKNVGLISLTETIDTTSAYGKFVFSIFGALAELERSMILDRVNDGIVNAKKNGKHCGRPPKIDRKAFEVDYLAGMKNGDLAVKYKITRMTVNRNIKPIKDRQKYQARALSEAPLHQE